MRYEGQSLRSVICADRSCKDLVSKFYNFVLVNERYSYKYQKRMKNLENMERKKKTLLVRWRHSPQYIYIENEEGHGFHSSFQSLEGPGFGNRALLKHFLFLLQTLVRSNDVVSAVVVITVLLVGTINE